MVTVDPGIRARASDVAALTPVAIAANLDQLDLVPNGVRAYLTCGDDDARAFAGKLPPKNVGARALFLNAQDACVLTGTDTAAGARPRRSPSGSRPSSSSSTRAACVAIAGGEVVEVPDFCARPGGRHHRRPRPAVRGLRLGRPARRAAARADRVGAALLAARDGRADRGRRRRAPRSACSRKGRSTGSPGPRVRAAEPADHDAMAEVFLAAGRAAWGFAGEEALAAMRAPFFGRGELVAEDESGVRRLRGRGRVRDRPPLHAPARVGERRRPRAAGGGRGGPARQRLHPRRRCGPRSATSAPAGSTRRPAGGRTARPRSGCGTARR